MSGRTPDDASEERLRQLRREAEQSGTVRGEGVRPVGAPFPKATPETGYYGLPLLKEPTWTWEVPLYFFVGGAAGAAAIIAASARLTGTEQHVVREGRRIAAAGALLSAPLLISDLGRPERFLNMLRVFKPKSPMSVGVWTLVAFSTAGTLAAATDLLSSKARDHFLLRLVGDISGNAAALTGAVMTTYTGVLLGATSIPGWSKHVTELPAHFAASSLGSAVALFELRGCDGKAVRSLGLAAALAESLMFTRREWKRRSLADRGARPIGQLGDNRRSDAMLLVADLLSGPLPMLLRLAGGRKARRLAGLASLTGSLLTRYGWLEAGRESARDSNL